MISAAQNNLRPDEPEQNIKAGGNLLGAVKQRREDGGQMLGAAEDVGRRENADICCLTGPT